MSLELALKSLDGLSVGDAFGECAFFYPVEEILTLRQWRWTDDTHMAISIVENLAKHGHIDQDSLAAMFGARYTADPLRGYSPRMAGFLSRLHNGEDWKRAAPMLFPGGSYGNGGAMRAAPIGGFFAGDPERSAEEGRRSAEITHAHPEGQAGAMAVAAAASIAAAPSHPSGMDFLQEVSLLTPPSEVRYGIEEAMDLGEEDSLKVGLILGAGQQVSAQDTVPFCIWCAAHNLEDFEKAMRTTVRAIGDRDTICAIVGGIVSLSSQAPLLWLEKREPLNWHP